MLNERSIINQLIRVNNEGDKNDKLEVVRFIFSMIRIII